MFYVYFRPPGIYKQDYIVELFQRYSDEEPILAPERPDWCFGQIDISTKKKNNTVQSA